MNRKMRLTIFILCCFILIVSAGCGKADKNDPNNMGNMDHSKMNMDNNSTKK